MLVCVCVSECLNRLDKLLAVAFSLVSTKWNGIMSGEKRHHQIRYKNRENGKHTHSHGDLLRKRDVDDGSVAVVRVDILHDILVWRQP